MANQSYGPYCEFYCGFCLDPKWHNKVASPISRTSSACDHNLMKKKGFQGTHKIPISRFLLLLSFFLRFSGFFLVQTNFGNSTHLARLWTELLSYCWEGAELLSYRTELLRCWASEVVSVTEVLSYWTGTDMLISWATEMLSYWDAELLRCWATEILSYWTELLRY